MGKVTIAPPPGPDDPMFREPPRSYNPHGGRAHLRSSILRAQAELLDVYYGTRAFWREDKLPLDANIRMRNPAHVKCWIGASGRPSWHFERILPEDFELMTGGPASTYVITPVPPRPEPPGVVPYEADEPPRDYPEARRAPDRRWYVPDPNRPGKYLMIIQLE